MYQLKRQTVRRGRQRSVSRPGHSQHGQSSRLVGGAQRKVECGKRQKHDDPGAFQDVEEAAG
jgi:hypothetical protein